MFDMGFWEMSLIFVILLVVVGPDRLPGVIRTVGLWVGRARRIVSSVRHEVEQELRVSEIRRSIDQEAKSGEFQRLADQVKSINEDVDNASRDLTKDISSKPSTPETTAQSDLKRDLPNGAPANATPGEQRD